MGKFETEVLPKGIADAQSKIESLQKELWRAGRKLDEDEEAQEHSCDCDRCPVGDYELLDSVERADLEEKYNDLDSEIDTLQAELKRMMRYKSFVEKI